MATGLTPEIRLVRCPTCRRLLAEPENVQVYECGGCFTMLQAKYGRINENGASTTPGTDAAETSEPHIVSEHEESNNSGHETVLPSAGESPLDQENERHVHESVDSINEQLADVKLSNGRQNESEEESPEAADTENDHLSPQTGGNFVPEVNNEAAFLTKDAETDTGSSNALVSSPEDNLDKDRIHGVGGSVGKLSDDMIQSRDVSMNQSALAYDASESSFEGREDQFPKMVANHSENTRSVPEGRFAKGKLAIHSDSEIHDRTRTSSVSSQEMHHRNRPIHGADAHQSRIPYQPRISSFSGAYEGGSPSDQSHDEFNSNVNQHGSYYSERVGQGRWRLPEGKLTGIPHSAEALNTGHRANLNFSSGQLPRHPRFGFPNSLSSYPASPPRSNDYGFNNGWTPELVSDAEDHLRQGNSGNVPKKHVRETQQSAKHHVRPITSGAPFVICYRCLKTLQLPVDFLIFKKRYHLLRCGACSSVLRFSLCNRKLLVPAIQDAQPNPSLNNDDVADGRNMSHDSSSSLREKSKLISNQSRTSYMTPGETSDVGSPSEASKLEKIKSSKNEGGKGSPLHRLLGYSTVSQVFKVSKRPLSRASSEHRKGDHM